MTDVLNEEFTAGNWLNYDTYDPNDRATLRQNLHVDIRDFESADRTVPLSVLDLSQLTMFDMVNDQVQTFDDSLHVLREGEEWTGQGLRTNTVNNPSFEVDTTGWVALNSGTIARDTTVFKYGSASLKCTWATGGSLPWYAAAAIVQPDEIVCLSCWIYIPTSWSGTAGPVPNDQGQITNKITLASSAANLSLRDQWQRIYVSYQSTDEDPLTFGFAVGSLSSGPPDVGDFFYIDGVQIDFGVSTPTPYFDGSLPGATWAGTVHNSDSLEALTASNVSLSTHNNMRSLKVNLDYPSRTLSSVIDPIDIETGFSDDDHICLTLPNFPKDWLDPATCLLKFTSNVDGDFTAGPTVSIPFSSSTVTLVNGNSELRVLRSVLDANGLDLTKITGILITLTTTWGQITNQVTNPTIASGALTNWNANNSTLSIVGTPRGFRATCTVAGLYGGYFVDATNMTVSPGHKVAARARFEASSNPARLGNVRIVFKDSGGVNIGGATIVGTGVLPGNESVAVGVAPVNAVTAYLECYSTVNGVVSETMDWRNVMFTKIPADQSTTPPYFDGDTPAFAWNGTVYASTSTGPVVNFAALRLLDKDWKYGAVDFNSRDDTLRRGIARNGDPAQALEYTHPIVWRASEVPGLDDPKPVDYNVAVSFNTGSRTGTSQISVYGRELTEDFMQQLDLNGLTMGALTNHEQPDLGEAAYNERVQTDLDPFKQEQLEGLTQFDLERVPDYLSASWIEYVLSWTSTTTTLAVTNTEGDGYTFNVGTALATNTNYVLVFELEDTAVRAAIFPLGDRGQIIYNAPVFDSTRIDDDFAYKRRKGRFGWYASLSDGDASIESIRFRSASYGEYRSLPYESLTPVVGAELSAESSPAIELFEDFVPTFTSTSVQRDNKVSTTGESWRVTDYGPYTYQGIQSNPFQITDFEQTEVTLDVFYPSTLDMDAGIEFFLKSQYDYLIALPKPRIYPDQWQKIRLRTPSTHLAQTGIYRFVAVQNKPLNLNWWIDNVRIFERTVSWHGRSYVDDPWGQTESDWTPFQNAFNRDHGGVLFQGRGRKLQIKGVGHKQSSTVGKIQFRPRYAEIGRFVWPEQELVNKLPPVAAYTTSNVSRTYTFNGFSSSDPDGMVVNWLWTISDGSTYVGPIIEHTFGAAGTYAVTLMVTDNNGLVHTTSANHSVV